MDFEDPTLIADLYVHDNFTLIKYSGNDSFQAFLRPKPEGTALATFPKNGLGSFSLPTPPDSIIYSVELSPELDPRSLFLYLSPNWMSQDNYFFAYNVSQGFNKTTGALANLTIT